MREIISNRVEQTYFELQIVLVREGEKENNNMENIFIFCR